LEFPVLVSVIVCVPLPPTMTFPKLSELGLAESRKLVANPVPLRGIARGVVGALLANERLPVTFPPALGVKPTVNVTDCPGVTVRGRLSPLRLKPVPATTACEMTRFAFPGLLALTVCVFVVPSGTVPKAMLEGTTEIEGVGVATPEPLAETVAGEFEAVLSTVTLPVWLPRLVGAHTTLKLAVCPTDNVIGRVSPVTPKAAPVGLI
jgi:hypothetical protein